MREYTGLQLSAYDGRHGAPAYVAYAGNVYDVTDSFLWQKGRHQARHLAGRDLTASLEEAPHGADVLERCPLIGVLVSS